MVGFVAWAIVVGILILIFGVAEILDWIGRFEIIEKRWPKVWAVMNNRVARLVVYLFMIVVYGKSLVEGGEKFKEPEPPKFVFSAPAGPSITIANPTVITRDIPVRVEVPVTPQRNWHFIREQPDPRDGADGLIASKVMIYPSRSLAAPYTLRATFSGEMHKLADVSINTGGYFQSGPMEIRGNVLIFGYKASPTLGPDIPLHVTVYGEKELEIISVECVSCSD